MNVSTSYFLLVSLSLLLTAQQAASSTDSLTLVEQPQVHQRHSLEGVLSDVQTDFDSDVEKLLTELNFRMMLHQLKKKFDSVLKDTKTESVREEKSAKRGRTFFIGRK
jgi:hypothetical protein